MKNQKRKPGRLFQLALNDAFQSRLVPSYVPELEKSKNSKRNVCCENKEQPPSFIENSNTNRSHVSETVPALYRTTKVGTNDAANGKEITELQKITRDESQDSKNFNCLSPCSKHKKHISGSCNLDLPCTYRKGQYPGTFHFEENNVSKNVPPDKDFIDYHSLHHFSSSEPAVSNYDLPVLMNPNSSAKNEKFGCTLGMRSWESNASQYDLPICHEASKTNGVNSTCFKNKNVNEDFSMYQGQEIALSNQYQQMTDTILAPHEPIDCHSVANIMLQQSKRESSFTGNSIQPLLVCDKFFKIQGKNSCILDDNGKFMNKTLPNQNPLTTSRFETIDPIIKPPILNNQSQPVRLGRVAPPLHWDKIYMNTVENDELDVQTEACDIKPPTTINSVYSANFSTIELPLHHLGINGSPMRIVDITTQADETNIISPTLRKNLAKCSRNVHHDFNLMKNNEMGMVKNSVNNPESFIYSDLLNNCSTSQSNFSLLRHFDGLIYDNDSKNSISESITEVEDTFFDHCNIQSFPLELQINATRNTENMRIDSTNRGCSDDFTSKLDFNTATTPIFNHPNAASKIGALSAFANDKNCRNYNLLKQKPVSKSGAFLSDSKIDILKLNFNSDTGTRFDKAKLPRDDRCAYSDKFFLQECPAEFNSGLVPSKVICKSLNIKSEYSESTKMPPESNFFHEDTVKDLSFSSDDNNTSLLRHSDDRLLKTINPPVAPREPGSQCVVEKSIKTMNSEKSYSRSSSFDTYFKRSMDSIFDSKYSSELEDTIKKNTSYSKPEPRMKFSASLDSGLGIASEDGWDDSQSDSPFSFFTRNLIVKKSIF